MWLFEEDLKKWEALELKVIETLSSEFNLIKNPDKKGIDLLIIEDWIEVKMDEYAKYSGNFYIEFECNNKPSWIFKDESIRLRYWAHSDWDNIYLIDWHTLKTWVQEKIDLCRINKSNTSKWFKVIENWGNWGRSKGLLVPVKELESLALKIYKIWK